jgi:hypothetical protein
MKCFEFIYLLISIMYIIAFYFFESLKSFEQKKSWTSSFNNISMTILLKKKSLINGFFYSYNNTTYVKLLSIII